MSEYYFDYQITVLSDGLGAFAPGKEGASNEPRLFFERDYSAPGVKCVMYLTLPRWDAKGKSKAPEDTCFDSVKLEYDVRGIDTVIFDREDAVFEYAYSFDKSEYRKQGYRFPVMSDENDFSGVGRITLKKKGSDAVSIAFFAVNFTFKKKIRYRVHGGKIILEGKDIREGLRLRINAIKGRYPCLAEDRKHNDGETFIPDFSQKSTYTYQIPARILGHSIFLSFDQREKDADKFYLLECIGNDSVRTSRREFDRPKNILFCPYCHRPVSTNAAFLADYKSGGGVACDGSHVLDDETGAPVPIYARSGDRTRAARNVMYCCQDFSDAMGKPMKKSDVDSNWQFSRVLPADFLSHRHFKVAVVGSKRAGKTTFISRMFDVTGDKGSTEMPARMMVNATSGKGFSLAPYTPRDLNVAETVGDQVCWTLSENVWFKNEEKNVKFYSAYSIDVPQGRYPVATDRIKEGSEDQSRDPMRFPFIFEVNRSDYIYFYDIAGEDAEKSGNRLSKMIKEAPSGIFYLVDGNSNQSGNESVSARIRDMLGGSVAEHPIAVILTKFDELEKHFDPNCHCLRADAFEMMSGRYEGSLLEENIELASEEIRAYLAHRGILPDFGPHANVRYFGMSSFADSRAVCHIEQKEGAGGQAEVNYLRYESSAKRMELPLIWMLRQLGCIV